MNGAQALANQINTFVLNDADGAQAIQLGANHVWKLSGKPDERMIEDYAGVMADTIRQHGADGLVLLPNTRRGKLLAAKLGYRLNAAVSNDASAVSVQDGKATIETHGLRRSGDWRRTHCHAVCGSDHQQRARSMWLSQTRHALAKRTPWSGRLRLAITRTATRARQSKASISTKPARWSALVAVLAAKRTLRWQNSFARR